MAHLRQANPRMVGSWLLLGIMATLAVLFATAFARPAHAGHNSAKGDAKGTTGGWYDGKTVTFVYPKDFFCKQPPSSGASSGCEVGAEAVTRPRPGANLPVLYVMTPLFGGVDPSTLQCPEAGNCINHPSTIDVSRVFGPGTEEIPLPAHSHIVDVAMGGWWEIEVIGVIDPAVWDQIVAAKDLDTVRALQAADPGQTKITGDIPSNLFLFFNVEE